MKNDLQTKHKISFKDFVKHFTHTHRTICKALKSMHLTKLISQL